MATKQTAIAGLLTACLAAAQPVAAQGDRPMVTLKSPQLSGTVTQKAGVRSRHNQKQARSGKAHWRGPVIGAAVASLATLVVYPHADQPRVALAAAPYGAFWGWLLTR